MRTTKENIKGVYPLSPMQEGMLHHALADTGHVSYMQQVCWSIRGALDIELLERSWNTLIARHDSLRTVFAHEGTDRPLQVVVKEASLKVDFQDLRAIDETRRESVRNEILVFQRTTPFNLSRDLLMRMFVIQRGDDLYDVVWTHHHLLLDGWSVGILLSEFLQIYSSLKEDRLTVLSPSVPVNGYISWLEQQSREVSYAFWADYLQGYSRIAEIPQSSLDLSANVGEQESVSTLLEPGLYGELQTRAAECGVTVSVLLQCIWSVILCRYNDCSDVVFGMVVSGRPAEVEGIEHMVGNLINTVPVRVSIEKDMSWRSLAINVQEQSLRSASHHHSSLAAIQRASALPAGLFSTIMVVESYPVDVAVESAARSGDSGFVLESTTIHERTNYALDIQFLPTNDGLRCTFFYGRDHYEDEQIEALIRHFSRCVSACVNEFTSPIDAVQILNRTEIDHLLFDLNSTVHPQPDGTVVDLFEQQVLKTPEAIALVSGNDHLSYTELNQRANRFAHALIDGYDVQHGDVVAILLSRSTEYIVSILGILKAGASYLPLDQEMPEKRLAHMVHECHAKYVILETGTLIKLPFKHRLAESFELVDPFFTSPRTPIANLDTLPIIDRSLIDYEAYHQFLGQSTARFSVAIQATRGCPYQCAYCHKIWPKKHVRRSPEHLFTEIEQLYECGVRRFVFIDDIFNLDRAASRSFFEKVIAKNLQCQFFFSNGLRGDILSHDDIDLMISAGTIQMAFALETASARLQKLIQKQLKIDRLHDNLNYIASKYPQVILELFTMHGFPSETPEEAKMTLEFMKGVNWIHFPYVFILRIFPDTEMAGIAHNHGISEQAIMESMELGYHELPTTLPFAREVATHYQMAFLNEYFLSKDRLKQVLPYQMKVMDERSLALKYDSYLPADIHTLDDLLAVAGLNHADLGNVSCINESEIRPPELNRRIAKVFAPQKPGQKKEGLRILLLDLSQYFVEDRTLLYDVVEPPLGLASLLTVLNQRFGEKITGKIAKARIDFEDFDGLRRLLEEFQPDFIGVRTLTYYKNFFHKSIELIRQWGFTVPIIAGGPYATSSTDLLLRDLNVDAAVIGEGEATICEIVEIMLSRNDGFAKSDLLKNVAGVAYIPAEQRQRIRNSSCQFLSMEKLSGSIEKGSVENPQRNVVPTDVAYIIYTSGSTGNPKGVVIEHHSIQNLIGWVRRTIYARYPSTINEATVAPLIFDVSVQQIFGAFLSGYTLHLVADETAADPLLLLDYLKEHHIQMVNVTPSRLAMMLDAMDQSGSVMVLDQLLVGAEKLSRSMIDRLYAHPEHRGIVIRNMYGPTECCVDASSFFFNHDSYRTWGQLPLGRAIDNGYFRILDRSMRLVPRGVFGELYVGGEGVAREYVNRPDESARSFVSDPYADGGRLYRTGDRARWTKEGMIEFGGRIDNQIKVRGYRIEPEEIEKCLCRHPAVANCAVTAIVSGDGPGTLTAFVVTLADITVEALQEYLRSYLPAYMIPSMFSKVDELPLNSSGKLDRRQLRSMVPTNSLTRGAEIEKARSEEEQVLALCWATVLGKDELSIHDNYFALGGDSIKAITVVSQVARAGWVVTIRDLFRYPTIAELAVHIAPVREKQSGTEVRADRGPLTPIQTSFFQNHTVEPGRFNHAMVLSSTKHIDIEALQAAWDCLLATHVSLGNKFYQDQGVWHQELSEFQSRLIEEYDIRNTGEKRLSYEDIAELLHSSLDIESGKLALAACIRTNDGDRVLLVIHHLVVDGISWRILLKELVQLYTDARAGLSVALTPSPVSLIQWANTLTMHMSDSRIVTQLPYWQAVAQSNTHISDKWSGARDNTYRKVSMIQFKLSREETEKLCLSAHHAYSTTVEDLLLCALGRALYAGHGHSTTLITLESHGREETFGLDLSRTCGWLTVTYPFALSINPERDVAYHIKSVKESLRAVPDSGIGYGILRFLTPDDITGTYDISCSPTICFNYLGRLEAQTDTEFTVELDSDHGSAVNPDAKRQHIVDVSGIVVDEVLNISLSYSRQACPEESAQSLADLFHAEILHLIQHCCDGRKTEMTPADFTYSDLTLDELEGII